MSLAWPVRVYVEDTDFGGVVYYANYLRWCERARTEWLRSKGYSQAQLARDPGVLFSVVSVQVDYRRPARLDDELTVTCEPRADGRASVRFAQRVLRGEELLVEADVRVACLAANTLRPTRLPDFVIAEVG
ncbi:MAG: tol-pal system-associated acyl-CoA thioesterase [Steroidobacteraceae bacterium]